MGEAEKVIRSEDYEWEDDWTLEEITATTRRLLDDLQELEDCFLNREAEISLWSGGGANGIVFHLKLGEDHSQFHLRSYGDAVGCVGTGVLQSLQCGTNLPDALKGMEYMNSSRFHLSTTYGKLTPPSWEDLEYVGSVPAVARAASAEEAVKIISTLREVEALKEKVLHSGQVGQPVLMEYKDHEVWRTEEARKAFDGFRDKIFGKEYPLPEVVLPEGYEEAVA